MRLKSILFILLSVLACNTFLIAENVNEVGYFDITIETNEDSESLPSKRAPSRMPIMGYYSNGHIDFVFRVDLGIVDCVIENSATLETWMTSFDSEAGYSQIEVSDLPGTYSVFLNTELGTFRSFYVIY